MQLSPEALHFLIVLLQVLNLVAIIIKVVIDSQTPPPPSSGQD